ncbi:hypothetical protein TIN2_22 [Tsukamurella phage TIN2]|uniref:Uncharacterized protein n=1 Tax=Tsukamurella phage TIN2 TaxID=1636545 RepID=A0A0K0N5M8_9CAUD|nr:hypothetical protein AVT55_gp101 [Tsukamurella phage TIN2]AKJ71712.1 hypothetical protein TIN2_22 [Tsukamurella phage TIN2]
MSNLLRPSINTRGGADPALWEKPVNQASKWLCARSGSTPSGKPPMRLLQEGGSITVENNSSQEFLISVFLGDGGSANLGGASGNSTVQISRAGSTITVKCQAQKGTNGTQTFTTSVGADRWSNIYLKCNKYGAFSDQVRVTAMCDFNETKQLIATGSFLGETFVTNGKTFTANSLSGWAWIASTTGGFWGMFGQSSVPITDVKYREAFINNATWDLDINTSQHDWQRPADLKTMRAWIIQAGGGPGGPGGNGGDGGDGRQGDNVQPRGCTSGSSGASGGPGGKGGPGGQNGSPGQNGSAGSSGGFGGMASFSPNTGNPEDYTSCSPGSAGSGGSGGSGGAGGLGGRGRVKQVAFTQAVVPCRVGVRGSTGAPGTRGTDGSDAGTFSSPSSGGPGGDGSPGGPGGATYFGNEDTIDATDISTPTIKFGATEFEHGCGGPGQDGGVVLYLIW